MVPGMRGQGHMRPGKFRPGEFGVWGIWDLGHMGAGTYGVWGMENFNDCQDFQFRA